MKKLKLAIIGASGLVGMMLLQVLEESRIEIDELYLYASSRSAGRSLKFRSKDYIITALTKDSFNQDIDIALFASSREVSESFIPIAIEKGIYVIDNSSCYRNDRSVPLIVVGINELEISKETKLIANPNCSTIQAVLALNRINELFTLKRIVYSTYQAVSGSGYKGILDLLNTMDGKTAVFYKYPIAYNLIPAIGEVDDEGNTIEEMKMINETKRIFNNENLIISATCVRVPVVNAHSISINVECIKEIVIDDLMNELRNDKYIKVYNLGHPTPREVSGSDLVHVGRIRDDRSAINGLSLFVVADNLRVGSATNAVRILKKLWEEISDVV